MQEVLLYPNCYGIVMMFSFSVMTWDDFTGVRVLALPGDAIYASNHGVYLADEQVGHLYNCTK